MFKQAELKKKIKTLGKELALNDNIEQSSRSKICINKTAIKFTKNLQSFPKNVDKQKTVNGQIEKIIFNVRK